jgi:osmotically-inducible protein OsmY
VGRDSREQTTFVGQQQGSATGRVQTAVASQPAVRFERNANLASQRTNQSTSGIYEPRLAIGFSFEPAVPDALAERLAQSLNALPQFRRMGPLSVTVDARTATIRGVVVSTEDRKFAEVIVGFEPGVSDVVNQLTVAEQ